MFGKDGDIGENLLVLRRKRDFKINKQNSFETTNELYNMSQKSQVYFAFMRSWSKLWLRLSAR